ncbi:MAG: glutaredoxin family protein [Firmicutes bacterium]|nr:glutaredoxin family protein [Bacillota bacterium]
MSILRKGIKSLQDQGASFKEINVSQNPEKIRDIVKLSGGRKVPVIVENDKVTVGFNGGG